MATSWDNQAVVATPDGVLYEVQVSQPSLARAGAGRGILWQADRGIGEAVSAVAKSIAEQLRNSDVAVETVEVEFGLKINAEAGFIVAATPDSGQFRVRLAVRGEEPS